MKIEFRAGNSIAKSDEFSREKKVSSSRFPEVPRYYGMPFIRWAICAEMRQYGYVGVDAFGEVQRFEGRLWRRWSDVRRKENLALIYSFAESLSKESEMYFCTLTVRHLRNHTYVAQKQAINDLRAAWDLFARYLRRVGGCRYLRFIEAGAENGFAHIHMVVSCPSSECRKIEKIPEKWVEKCRKIGNSAEICGQNIQKIDSTSEIRNVGAYISKYLSKTLESGKDAENIGFWRWMEICYRLRLRTVSMDSVSRQYIKRKYAKVEDIAGISGVFGELMIRDPCDSKSLDEVEEILQSGRPAARWELYVIRHGLT